MVTIVITLNVLIALGCFYATWQIWKIRRTLAGITRTLESVERSTHKTLNGAPRAIVKGQLGIYQLRQAYQRSGPQLQRVRGALALLGLGQSFLRRPDRFFKPAFLPQRRARAGSQVGATVRKSQSSN